MENDTRDRLQTVLGDAYRIERELGGGGMSQLFLAVERSLGRRVVVKLLPPEWTSEVSAQRFQREITLTANLPHPHILPILAAGSRDGHLYYVTPYLQGESLAQRLRSGRLGLGEALRFLLEIADALAFAHAHGVVHRDVKPANVLLQDGHAVLADFGVARALEVSTAAGGVTRTGLTVGTPGYMAPEQLAGDPSVDARADVYALSVLAYEMLAGKPPFVGTDAMRLAAAHLSETPRPLRELCPEAPAAVAEIVMRGLAKSPTERPASATEFRESFTTHLRAHGRQGRQWAVAALAAVSAIVIASSFLIRGSSTATSDPSKLVIAPIAVMDPTLGEWRMGIVDWLSRTLDGAGELRTVPASAIAARSRNRSDIGALAIARQLGAGIAVDGSLIRAGRDSVRLAMTVRDALTDRALAEINAQGAESDFDRLMDTATVQILQGLGRSRTIGALRYASLGSRSLPAIKAFLRGEEQYRRLDLRNARQSYEEAVQLDSTFAPALRKLAQTLRYDYTEDPDTDDRMFDQAVRHNKRLGARDSLLVLTDSMQAVLGRDFNGRNVGRALALVEEMTRRYEDDAEAWGLLANMHYWYGFVLNRSVRFSAEARRALQERAIAADSMNVDALFSSAAESVIMGDSAAARRRLTQCVHTAPPGYGNSSCAMFLALLDNPDAKETLALIDTVPFWAEVQLSAFVDLPDARETSVTAARRFAARPRRRPESELGLVRALAARGHLEEAWKRVSVSIYRPAFMGQIAALGGVAASVADKELRQGDSKSTYQTQASLLWWFVAQRDTAVLLDVSRANSAANFRDKSDAEQLAAKYRHAIAAAYLSLARADTAKALQVLLAVPDSACGNCMLLRYSVARLHAALGALREAAGWLAQTPLTADVGPMAVMWRLERARVLEQLGSRAQAIDDYRYVAGMWQNADSVLQSYVAESRRALTRLAADR